MLTALGVQRDPFNFEMIILVTDERSLEALGRFEDDTYIVGLEK